MLGLARRYLPYILNINNIYLLNKLYYINVIPRVVWFGGCIISTKITNSALIKQSCNASFYCGLCCVLIKFQLYEQIKPNLVNVFHLVNLCQLLNINCMTE